MGGEINVSNQKFTIDLEQSSVSQIVEINDSFDRGTVKVCYHGKNNNKSKITKEVIEECISSLYCIPVVGHYVVASTKSEDDFGEHDIEFRKDADGNFEMYNLTEPVGFVPESAKWWWEETTDSGGLHEYLCCEVILWKRQRGYSLIKDNGITKQSMEISVSDGETEEDFYNIKKFQFTALCLLGQKYNPCFEDSSLSVFTQDTFAEQYTLMCEEFKQKCKETFSTDDIKKIPEGGNEMQTEDKNNETNTSMKFELASNIREFLRDAIGKETVNRGYGEYSRYWFVDYDADKMEVYAEDSSDWKIYGFSFTSKDDSVTVDFSTKKRKKYALVDFVEGTDVDLNFSVTKEYSDTLVELNTAKITSEFTEKISGLEAVITEKDTAIADITAENTELKEFKASTLEAQKKYSIDKILEGFADVVDTEEFKAIKDNVYTLDETVLKEKCFAIRGMKFSLNMNPEPKNTNSIMIPVIPPQTPEAAPYGGTVEKYKN